MYEFVLTHCACYNILKPVFSKASMYNIQCGVAYILIHCVFDSSIARKCMRADDEKQEINLVWPYCLKHEAARTYVCACMCVHSKRDRVVVRVHVCIHAWV